MIYSFTTTIIIIVLLIRNFQLKNLNNKKKFIKRILLLKRNKIILNFIHTNLLIKNRFNIVDKKFKKIQKLKLKLKNTIKIIENKLKKIKEKTEKIAHICDIFELDKFQQQILNNIIENGNNYFIQGSAGTGKSNFIKHLKIKFKGRCIVVAPTAVTALNISASTIHSAFLIPPNDFIDLNSYWINKELIEVLKKTDILIVDEISMVRPDLLDAIKKAFNIAKKNIQTILLGDLYQIPPIITASVNDIFKKKYKTEYPFFFDSNFYKDGKFTKIFFNKVYRQTDLELLKQLDNLKNAVNIDETIKFINNLQIQDKNVLEKTILITPIRAIAKNKNDEELNKINKRKRKFVAILKGSFKDINKNNAPVEETIFLKVGANVIFCKNTKYFFNGQSGIIKEFNKINGQEYILVNSKNIDIVVFRHTWKSYKYKLNEETDEIVQEEDGEFIQFPLQLGYATTVHKAQGKTLDNICLDFDCNPFTNGLLYVAMSRTHTSKNIHIKNYIAKKWIYKNERVEQFLNDNL